MVQQEEGSLNAQRRITDECTAAFTKAEKDFFNADRALTHYAESLESILESKQLLQQLDDEKYVEENRFVFKLD